MKTKYNVSLENTYFGAINPPPDSLLKDMLPSIQNSGTATDDNNNQLMFSSLSYECWMKSATMGEIRFYAGHHKQTFSTCDRYITCKVTEGQMKIKCGSQKWTVTKSNTITLQPNSKYFVKNNSLRNDCVVTFTFGEN